jgi:hypothetical protein
MDYESDRSRMLGNFNAIETLTPFIHDLESAHPTPDFVMPDDFRRFPIYTGFGKAIDEATVDFWWKQYSTLYQGDDGRLRLKEVRVIHSSRTRIISFLSAPKILDILLTLHRLLSIFVTAMACTHVSTRFVAQSCGSMAIKMQPIASEMRKMRSKCLRTPPVPAYR